jgi:hypothetical protein
MRFGRRRACGIISFVLAIELPAFARVSLVGGEKPQGYGTP